MAHAAPAEKKASPHQSLRPERAGRHRPKARTSQMPSLQTGGVLLSLCGVLACGYLGFGLGRAVCHGLLVASLGAPVRRAGARRAKG